MKTKKIQRCMGVLVSLCILLTLIPSVFASPGIDGLGLPDTWKAELREAEALGLPLEGLGKDTVSGREMSALLDALVKYAAPDKLAQWQALLPALASHDAPLTRFDAMGALYLAAGTIGGRWAEPLEGIGEVWADMNFQFDDYFFSEGLFSAVDGPKFMTPNSPKSEAYLDNACLCYTLSRRSPVSGEFLFAYDKAAHSIHADVPPTYAEAALAVVRLILSDRADGSGAVQTVHTLSADKDAQLQRELQAAIDAILASETGIVHSTTATPGETYTGKAYYVSADGSDSNNGLSPDKPWRTLEKVAEEAGAGGRSGKLKAGDAVFFRRGDLFRFTGEEQCLIIRTSGLTFSAYGEGPKPIITGSSQSGVGAEKWKLVSDEGGKKIWQYYKDMPDIACVVLNDGQEITKRVYEFYNGKSYESCDCDADAWLMQSEEKGVTLKGRLLSPQESLTEDMTIISRPACGKTGNVLGDEIGVGPLYLRCDAGNPGEVFSSVEFSERHIMGLVWLCAGDTVFDNLSFRCNGTAYIKNGAKDGKNWKDVRNTLVQNCEFAFGGGSVTFYRTAENGEAFVGPQGDGIYTVVCNTTVRGNYFHDSPSTTATYEQTLDYDSDIAKAGPADGYYRVLDNVMVNTIGVRIDSTSDLLKELDSVVIRGNRIWNTGRMDNSGYYYSEGAVIFSENHYKEFVIQDNVLYGTENGYISNGLLNISVVNLLNSTLPTLSNNTYVQHSGRPFVYFQDGDVTWSMEDPELIDKVRFLLRDTTSEFYRIGGQEPPQSAPSSYVPSPTDVPTFTDVPDWCAAEVSWAVSGGVTKGTSETQFSPGTICSTGEVLTFLYRARTGNTTVPAGEAWYAAPMGWAAQQGLISADADRAAPCTRADVVTYLWKLAGSPATAYTGEFSDVSADAAYAQAVAWAVAHDITKGVNGGGFAPEKTCTRGEIVTFLYRDRSK